MDLTAACQSLPASCAICCKASIGSVRKDLAIDVAVNFGSNVRSPSRCQWNGWNDMFLVVAKSNLNFGLGELDLHTFMIGVVSN